MLKQRSDLYFFIIGTGELKDDLIRYADLKKVSSHLFFIGFRSDSRVLMKTFDLLLMSSQTEGIPLTIYEAFAEEIPVVTTNAGGISEVIINNETGFHTPVKDSQSLAKNALKVLNDKTLKCKLTDNALNLVHQKFTFEVMQKNYLHFYHSLIQKGDR